MISVFAVKKLFCQKRMKKEKGQNIVNLGNGICKLVLQEKVRRMAIIIFYLISLKNISFNFEEHHCLPTRN